VVSPFAKLDVLVNGLAAYPGSANSSDLDDPAARSRVNLHIPRAYRGQRRTADPRLVRIASG
jgi:hypothetical protein